MAVIRRVGYSGMSEADAIRGWCRSEIDRLEPECELLKHQGLTGAGSRHRIEMHEWFRGHIKALERILETEFVEEDKVADTWNCPICKQESSGMVNDDG